MSRAIWLSVLTCFVAISMVTNYGFNYTAKASWSENLVISAPAEPFATHTSGGSNSDTLHHTSGDGECQCKKKTGTMNLICGVTLALVADSVFKHIVQRAQAQPITHEADSTLDIVWKFKRPPRFLS